MAWTLTDDLDDYIAAAGGFLRSRPVQHTIQLSAIETLRLRGSRAFGGKAPLYGWWLPAGGEVTAAMLHTPPYGILVTELPGQAGESLAKALAARGRHVPSVNASQADADSFAAAWTALAGGTARVFRCSRLYALARLEAPAPAPPGAARVAAAADLELVESLFSAVSEEIADLARPPAGLAEDRLSHGGVFLWEDQGAAVSMAAMNRPVAGTVRVGPVYTPPEFRRRGFAAAVTAAVTQAAIDRGADHVVLFTDLANPTSNSVYQRIGYRPVEDRVVLAFSG